MSAEEHEQGRRVVVGADGSESGYAAVRQAAHEARGRAARLDIVHVIPVDVPVDVLPHFPDGSLQAFGSSVIDQATATARDVRADLDVRTHLLSGARVDRLLELSHGAELLVLGSRTASTLELLWTGDTCAGVAARAAMPVLVVPSVWRVPESPMGIVVGYKSATDSGELVTAGLEEARRRTADLLVLHAWKLPGAYDDVVSSRVDDERWNRAERSRIEREIADRRADHPDVAVEVQVAHDRPARALVAASRSAELLVLSRPTYSGHFHHLGGTLRRVLRMSECPVQIIPPSKGPGRSSDPLPTDVRPTAR